MVKKKLVAKGSTAAVFIQVTQTSGAVKAESATDDFIKATQEKLKEVSQLVKTSWASMVKDISSMPGAPSEIALEFGIDVGVEGSVPFITKGSIGANFKVSITWKKD
jgi:Trypsin-co-occurring domain 1